MSQTLGRKNIGQDFTVVVDSPVTMGSGDNDIPLPFPATVEARPGADGTLLIEHQVTSGGAWVSWDGGVVTVPTTYCLDAPVVALRFTAALSNGIVGVSQ